MEPAPDLVLSVDLGTSGCKVAVYDAAGVCHGRGYVAYESDRPHSGVVEQDPERWWSALVAATRQALQTARGDAVVAMALSSTNALVVVDGRGRPIRPAIMQLDARAHATARLLRQRLGAEAVLQRTGNSISAGPHWLPTLAWLRQNEPLTMARSRTLLYPGGWLALRLTGVRSVDPSRAATSLLLEASSAEWCGDLADLVGVDVRMLPDIYPATEAIGGLLPGSAEELGLRHGTLVAAGAMDSAAAALGAGAASPGDAVVALGTTGRFMLLFPDCAPLEGVVSCPYPGSTAWLSMGVSWLAGQCLREAASRWSSKPDFIRLEAALADVTSDATGLSQAVQRADSSVSPGASVEDDARRLVMEVVTDLARCAERLGDYVTSAAGSAVLVGGGARSDALASLLARALRLHLRRPRTLETEPLGGAMLAAVAAGMYPDLRAAASAMVEGKGR